MKNTAQEGEGCRGGGGRDVTARPRPAKKPAERPKQRGGGWARGFSPGENAPLAYRTAALAEVAAIADTGKTRARAIVRDHPREAPPKE